MRVYLMTERRLGVRWGAVFCCYCCFCFFFSLVCFSQANLKCLVYTPGTGGFLSRVQQDASVSVDLLPKAETTGSEAAGHY